MRGLIEIVVVVLAIVIQKISTALMVFIAAGAVIGFIYLLWA